MNCTCITTKEVVKVSTILRIANRLQLLILAIRPILFVAVKKAVADRYISGCVNIQSDSRASYLRTCSDAARRNLRLGRWILELGRSPRLRQANLHHVFNASVVLELNQLLFEELQEADATEVAFATKLLDTDVVGNSDYARDCAKVLSDLTSLRCKLRNDNTTIVEEQHPRNAVEHLMTADQVLNHTPPSASEMPGIPDSLHRSSQHDLVYNELLSWLQDDDPQF